MIANSFLWKQEVDEVMEQSNNHDGDNNNPAAAIENHEIEVEAFPAYNNEWWEQTKANARDAWQTTQEGAESAWQRTREALDINDDNS